MRIPTTFSAAAVAALLAGCGVAAVAPGRIAHSERSVLRGAVPAHVYARVARQVHACWFAPADPVLTHHVFHAEAPAGRDAGGATHITIYDKAPDGRRGLKAYSIAFERRGRDTVVTTLNHRLPYALAQKMSADVGFWVHGGPDCNASDGSGPLRGSFPGAAPRVAAPAPTDR